MVEILRNKNLATRFQILAEIANSSPNIQQRDIAQKLGITPQAVSDYIKQLVKGGLLTSGGRSKYHVTADGVNWMIKVLRELSTYHAFVEKSITNISVSAAVAEDDITKGQKVGLAMRGGLLFATRKVAKGASGIAFSNAMAGEAVGVTDINGIVDFKTGKVTILEMPGIEGGGFRMLDGGVLQKYQGEHLIGAIGIEAIVALKQAGIEDVYIYGVTEAVTEAANSGLDAMVVCVNSETSRLMQKLGEKNIAYEVIDLKKAQKSRP